EALAEFARALKTEPRYFPARHYLALAQVQAGNLQQARAELREVVAAAPQLAEAVLLLAELNIRSGAPQPAIDELEKLLTRDPRNTQALLLLGSAYMAKQDPAKAGEIYRRVIASAPKDPRGPHLLGMTLRAQRRNAEARAAFESALTLTPGYADALAQVVSLSFAEKNPNGALERVKRQIAAVPSSGALYHLLGQTHLTRRESAEAEAAFLKAVQLDPRLSAGYRELGRLYASSERWEDALTRFNDALRVNPRDVVALTLTGVVQERKGAITEAQAAYEKA